jgi:hypothetical protein
LQAVISPTFGSPSTVTMKRNLESMVLSFHAYQTRVDQRADAGIEEPFGVRDRDFIGLFFTFLFFKSQEIQEGDLSRKVSMNGLYHFAMYLNERSPKNFMAPFHLEVGPGEHCSVEGCPIVRRDRLAVGGRGSRHFRRQPKQLLVRR